MKHLILIAAVASLTLLLTLKSQAQTAKTVVPFDTKTADAYNKFTAVKPKANLTRFRTTPNLFVSQFNAIRFADKVSVYLLVYNDGPFDYTGGRSYVIEEFLPGGGSNVLQTGPIPLLRSGGFKAFQVLMPYDNRAHTYFARLIPGDRVPQDDVGTCNIQPNAPDHTKHPRER